MNKELLNRLDFIPKHLDANETFEMQMMMVLEVFILKIKETEKITTIDELAKHIQKIYNMYL